MIFSNRYLMSIFCLLFLYLPHVMGQRNCQSAVCTSGYLMYVDYSWFFAPSVKLEESKDSVLNIILSSSSFRIQLGTDGFNNQLRDLENFDGFETDTVLYKWHLDSIHYGGELHYKYVQLKYKGLSKNTFELLDTCLYEIQNEGETRYMGCIYNDIELVGLW